MDNHFNASILFSVIWDYYLGVKNKGVSKCNNEI